MLRLEINTATKKAPVWEPLYLPEDASIDMEVNSPLWNDASTYSYSFDIPVEPNRHLLGSIDTLHGKSVYDALYDRQYRLWVMGTVLSVGVIKLDDEVEIDDGMVEIELTSGRKSLDDLLEGVSCRDIDLERENGGEGIVVGYTNAVKNGAINDPDSPVQGQHVRVSATHYVYTTRGSRLTDKATIAYANSKESVNLKSGIMNCMQQLQLSLPLDLYEQVVDNECYQQLLKDERVNRNYHNNTLGYNQGATFCHIPICYQRYEKEGDSWNAKRGYQDTKKYGDPGASNRDGSAPCFFVMYVVDLLFKQFGIPIVQNSLKDVNEVNLLAFIHTDWHVTYGKAIDGYSDPNFLPIFRRADGLLKGNIFAFAPMESQNAYTEGYERGVMRINQPDVLCRTITEKGITQGGFEDNYKDEILDLNRIGAHSYEASMSDGNIYEAIATSENLPDADVKEVIEGLESMFGCRFMYDDSTGTLRIVMLRDVLGSNVSTDLGVVDYAVHKKENHTRGFRLKYKNSSTFTPNELQKRLGNDEAIVTGSDDTTYNYNDWDKVVVVSDAFKSDYGKLINNVTCFDETCYVDRRTGNAYRIKVDSDAETEITTNDKKGLEPSLFEVGGYRDVNIGDCSDEEFVETVEIGFNPVIPNDMNAADERMYYKNGGVDDKGNDMEEKMSLPRYAVFADAELHPCQDGTCNYDVSVGSLTAHNGKEVPAMLHVQQLYPMMPAGWDVSQGFDSPLQSCDFGLTVGVLRPGDMQEGVTDFNYDYDGRGGSQWMQYKSSGSQMTSDSVDEYGNLLSYRTTDKGMEPGLCLKLKAEKLNPYHFASPDNPVYKMTEDPYKDLTDADGYFPIVLPGAAKRGLYDQFYTEYAYWVIHRKIAVIDIPRGCISISKLAAIDVTKKYRIGKYVGFINNIKYTIDKDGLGDVQVELYYI